MRFFWEVNISIPEKSNMLVSVSFSLKLVKMKVVTRLEMFVSTVTIHRPRPAFGLQQSARTRQETGDTVPSKLLSIDLPLFLPDWLIMRARDFRRTVLLLQPPTSNIAWIIKNPLTSPSFLCLRKSIRKFADINKLKALNIILMFLIIIRLFSDIFSANLGCIAVSCADYRVSG